MAKKPLVDPDPLELYNLGALGMIADLKPHLLPPEAFSNSNNVRFNTDGVSRGQDLGQVFGTLSAVPEFIFNVPAPSANFWLYASLTKVYAYDGTTSTDITRTAGNYTVGAGLGRNWQGTLLGNVPVLNNQADAPQYWTGLSTASKLADLDGWPSGLRAKIIRAAGPYLIAFNLIDGSAGLQKTIQWSSFADPGTIPASWDYNDPTVDAGRAQLTDAKGGEILEAVLLGNSVVVYTSGSTHVLKYVGGTAIFSPNLLLTESGILASRCATNYNKGTAQFVVTSDDIIIHTGTQTAQSIVEDKVRKKIFSELDTQNFANSFAVENTAKKEVWFCYPTKGNTYPDIAFIWNYKNNTCTFKDIDLNSADAGNSYDVDATTWSDDTENWNSDSSPWNQETRNVVIGVDRSASKAFQIDALYDNVPAAIERTGLAIDGKDRQGNPKASTKSVKQINRMWIKATGTAILTVRVGSQDVIDGPITWANPQDFNCAVDEYLDWCVVGKLLAYRIESTSADPWTIQGIDFNISVLSQL
jgi:hypothetical protein